MQLRVGPFAAALALLTWSGNVEAGPIEDKVAAAINAITEGDFDAARKLLDDAEEEAPDSQTVILGRTLASIDYYRGVMEFFGGDRDKKTLEFWRSALEKDIGFGWDAGLVADQEAQDLFEALRSEVDSRDQFDARVPEEGATYRVYVDGRMLSHYDSVVAGVHLVQLMCGPGVMVGTWHEFGEAPEYEGMCPTEGDGAAVSQGDEEEEPKEKEPKEKEPKEKEPKEPKEPKEKKEGGGVSVAKIGMIGGGVALVGGGVATYFVLFRPNYDEYEYYSSHPDELTSSIEEDIESRHQRYRFATLGLWGVGALVAVTGAVVPLGDTDLQLIPVGNGLILQGRF